MQTTSLTPKSRSSKFVPLSQKATNTVTMEDFLTKISPYKEIIVSNLIKDNRDRRSVKFLNAPEIELFCSNCKGSRYFSMRNSSTSFEENQFSTDFYLYYLCNNCKKNTKTYAIKAGVFSSTCMKYGEWPTFGDKIPNYLLKLFDNDREIFIKGKQCENQGLGIAAFAYYRRVVENQKNKIIDEIIKAAQKSGNFADLIDDLEKAKNEGQFKNAIKSIKHTLPQSLLINGDNPLTLLYQVLSEGLHKETDEECLFKATAIREILIELIKRISQILAENQSLNNALTILKRAKAKNK